MPDGPVLHRLAYATHPINPAAPDGPYMVSVIGTVNLIGGGTGGTSQVEGGFPIPGSAVNPIGAYYGGRTVASGGVFAPAISGSAILQVEVVTGSLNGAGGGGGFATVGVYGSVGVLGTVNVANPQATVNVAGGAITNTQATLPLPVANLGGSITAFQGSAPWSLTGSVNASGTVNIGNTPNVVGSVNILRTTATTTLTAVTGTTGAVTLLNGNGARRMASIYNGTPANLFLAYGQAASTGLYAVKVTPSGYFELPEPVYTGTISGAWDGSVGVGAMVTEFS